MYGCLRGLKPTLDQAIAEGRTWYYADNSYFRRAGRDVERGYFRVTRNALQHDGRGKADSSRWKALGLTIAPWRASGNHVLVCPPDAAYGALWGLDHRAWLRDALAQLRAATDRPIIVRDRSLAGSTAQPFVEALQDCWALVTHQSNAAVEALLAGVPVFVTGKSAAACMGKSDLSEIEEPAMPRDRRRWASVLAANQWTLSEMRSGTCWRDLQRVL